MTAPARGRSAVLVPVAAALGLAAAGVLAVSPPSFAAGPGGPRTGAVTVVASTTPAHAVVEAARATATPSPSRTGVRLQLFGPAPVPGSHLLAHPPGVPDAAPTQKRTTR
ncbi:hypothetical protein [Kitasatospora sp. NPDC094015]|uniref:hypothetical protein n=1 Tax=Kitasatospora sp. NPDC094015 TaxID=3155205 RepID=UPI003332EEB3